MLAIVQKTGDALVGLTPQDSVSTLKLTAGGIDELTYTIYPESEAWGTAQERLSEVAALDKQIDEEVFRGRVRSVQGKSSGSTTQSITCEGAAARLRDGIFAGSVTRTEILSTALSRILSYHRDITAESSHVYLGDCPMTIVEQTKQFDYVTTLEAINEVLTDAGLEWRIRYNDSNGHYMLDVAAIFGGVAAEPIVIGSNLGTVRFGTDISAVATRIVPLGGIGYNGERLTVRTYRGRDSIYIDRTDLIADYGTVVRKVIHDDIACDDPATFGSKVEELFNAGLADAEALTGRAATWDITAVDLARAGYNIDTFRVGWYYHIMHPILGADVTLRLVEMTIDYRDPQRSKLTFGDKAARLTSSVSNATQTAQARQTAQIINVTQMIDSRLDGLRLLAMSEVDYNALQTKQSDVLYIATTSNDFTLYYGTLPLRSGGGPVVDENQALVNAVWATETGSDIPTLAVLVDTPTNPSATYWLVFTGVGWWAALVPYDASTDYKKIKAKIRFATTYSNQGLYKYSDLTPPGIVPNASYNSKYLQFAENETDPIKFKVGNLSNMSACHPEISDRYTFTEGGWYDYSDEYDFDELFDVGLTAQDNVVIVRFASGDYIYRYPSGQVPTAHIENGTVFRFDAASNVDYVKISDVIGTAYTAIPTFSYTSSSGAYSVDPATEALLATTCDIYDSTNGNLLFAKNADITDYIAT